MKEFQETENFTEKRTFALKILGLSIDCRRGSCLGIGHVDNRNTSWPLKPICRKLHGTSVLCMLFFYVDLYFGMT